MKEKDNNRNYLTAATNALLKEAGYPVEENPKGWDLEKVQDLQGAAGISSIHIWDVLDWLEKEKRITITVKYCHYGAMGKEGGFEPYYRAWIHDMDKLYEHDLIGFENRATRQEVYDAAIRLACEHLLRRPTKQPSEETPVEVQENFSKVFKEMPKVFFPCYGCDERKTCMYDICSSKAFKCGAEAMYNHLHEGDKNTQSDENL